MRLLKVNESNMDDDFNNHIYPFNINQFGFNDQIDLKKIENLVSKFYKHDMVSYVLWMSIANFQLFKEMYGSDMADYIMTISQQAIQNIASEYLKNNLYLLETFQSGEFLLLLNEFNQIDITFKLAILRLKIKIMINRDIIKHIGNKCDIKIGHSTISKDNISLIHKAIYEAKLSAISSSEQYQEYLVADFSSLITKEKLCPHYQPIVDLSNANVIGWESLIRCQHNNSHFDSPDFLFNFAEEIGSLFLLEEICRHLAIKKIGILEDNQKIFINIHPKTLADPKFKSGQTLELLKQYGLYPRNIVFEITEKHSIHDFKAFYTALEHYRLQGYSVAIDDVGAGYSGLLSIAETRPDFIKIDMSLIRNIDKDPIRRSLVESILSFAHKIDCKVIAEGIETDGELSSLINLGIDYGQGFRICRPSFPKPLIDDGLKEKINIISRENLFISKGDFKLKSSMPIEILTEKVITVNVTDRIKDVKNHLSKEVSFTGAVVLDDERPVGLIMGYHLDRQLSTQYGVALYINRQVTQLMDSSPLIVEADMPIEKVAKKAMEREHYKVYDHIIVVKKGKYIGIVSVQNMLNTLAKLNIEMAKGTNPLTGLPGNLAIEQEIEMYMNAHKPFYLIYADLDNFKIYNDVYGFKQGDKIILLLSHILIWASKKYGYQRTFVGHLGGDDFIVVQGLQESLQVEFFCKKVVDCFKRLVRRCYTCEDLKRGYIRAKDRDGIEKDMPLVSLSLAALHCDGGHCSMADLAKKSSELKKYAKTIPGSCWVIDRRRNCSIKNNV